MTANTSAQGQICSPPPTNRTNKACLPTQQLLGKRMCNADVHDFSFVVAVCLKKNCLKKRKKQNLHPWVKVDQAFRPLPPKTLSILVGVA